MTIEWDKKYELHISVIDAQHKQIISCLNELETAMAKGVKAKDISEILSRTQQYAVRHFGIEEKYMKESKYPGLDKQLQAHKFFTERFTQILQEFSTNGLTSAIVNSLRQELSEWIKNHVIGLDLAFGTYYQNFQAEITGTSKKT